ncbi:PLP-dependent aminotransferase family protein [Peptostreptococcus equinus]|uniref:PLP-dependent aminotransferase family protein n=1 Tax=Peptostreptococcus equinus TaxID=3003601 RepID=A0ABY7JPM7_9FIRM|nr:PLP-dependent aminotransferase family protein [Peptostreptococcus sp. CBA3647]WAW15325.1 PLP-dependent aminotransferase family protein [Peptostreptococcus sp. CBA3647]
MFNIDINSNKTLYISIYESIKNNIEENKMIPDEKLPSKRSLAESLNVSTVTVQNAYNQLLAEGYIYSKEKIGYFVSNIDFYFNNTRKASDFFNKVASKDEKINIDLSKNSINTKLFPFSTWSKLMRQVISENYDLLLDKLPNAGLWDLRVAICQYIKKYKDINVNPNNIIIGSGTEHLYGQIVKLLGRDKIYAIEDPGYQKIYKIYKSEHTNIIHIPVDDFGMRTDFLYSSNLNGKSIDYIHITPSHQYPTGIVMPITRRSELLKWANESNSRYIIEDDYDSEFRYTGRTIPPIKSIDNNDKVIYINTFSNTISPSLRISYMILPDKLVKLYEKKLSFYSCTVTSFEQYTLARFISQSYYSRHIRRMRKIYKNNLDEIVRILESSKISNKIKIYKEKSGLHFVMKIKSKKNDLCLKKDAEKYGLNLSFLSEYSKFSQCENSICIVNYAGIEPHIFNNIIDILDIIM